jgi:cyclic pyranopterin monophosphate synthase
MATRTRRHPASEVRLSHVDEAGAARMVDVSAKPATQRHATAQAQVLCTSPTRDALAAGHGKKGDAISTARIAGIMAAKRTGELIPLCHPLALTDVQVDIDSHEHGFVITATARCVGPTGVEMEAMTAATVAALTLYDMGKAAERTITISDVKLLEKAGGKSGLWQRPTSSATSTARKQRSSR